MAETRLWWTTWRGVKIVAGRLNLVYGGRFPVSGVVPTGVESVVGVHP